MSIAPYQTSASSEKPTISTDFSKPLTASSESLRAPLVCDLVILGTRDMKKFSIDPSSLKSPSSPLLESIISRHIAEINSVLSSDRYSTYSTPIESDPNTEPTTKYFKRFMKHYFAKKMIDMSRTSVHMNTNFNYLQIVIYKFMNSDVPNLTQITDKTSPHQTSRRHSPLLRTKSNGSLTTSRAVTPTIPEQCIGTLTPKDKLTLFIEIINRLKGRIFDAETTDRIVRYFKDENLVITNLKTLLIAAGSEIPFCSGGTLNPGDLGILVELFNKNEPDVRRDFLLVIHNNIAKS